MLDHERRFKKNNVIPSKRWFTIQIAWFNFEDLFLHTVSNQRFNPISIPGRGQHVTGKSTVQSFKIRMPLWTPGRAVNRNGSFGVVDYRIVHIRIKNFSILHQIPAVQRQLVYQDLEIF